MTATRSPSVMASVWSWVTYTMVVPKPLLEPRHLGTHLHAQLRVEVRQRLVHQERGRVAHDRAAHRDPLALATGEVRRFALASAGSGRGPAPPPRPSRRSSPAASWRASARRPCSRALSCAGTARSSGTPSRCRGPSGAMLLTTLPPIRSSPSLMSSSPAIMLSVVDFPQPEGPTRITNSPSAISRLMLSTASAPSG